MTLSETIFVVEPERASSMSSGAILESTGYAVRRFDSAEEVLSLVDSIAPPKMIVCDRHLPGISGVCLATRLLTDERWCLVPWLLLAAGARREDINLLHNLPVPPEAFLIKPVEAYILLETVDGIIGGRKPIGILRGIERMRLSLELRSRRREEDLANQLHEVSRQMQEVVTSADRAEVELQALRESLLPKSTAECGNAHGLDRPDSPPVETQKQWADLDRKRRALLHEQEKWKAGTARDLASLDARMRIAQDLVRCGSKSSVSVSIVGEPRNRRAMESRRSMLVTRVHGVTS